MAQIKGIWKLRKAGAMPAFTITEPVNFPYWGTGEMMNGISLCKKVPAYEGSVYSNQVYFHSDFYKYVDNNMSNFSDVGVVRVFPLGIYDNTISDSVTWTDGEMPENWTPTLDFGTDGQEVSEEFYYWVQKNMIEQPRSIEGTWHVQNPVCSINYSYANDQGVSLNFTDMNGKEYVEIKEYVDDLGNVTFQAIDTEGTATAFIQFPHSDDELPTMIEKFTSIQVTSADDHTQALQLLLSVYNKEPAATFDLSTLNLDDQVHTITVVAKADNYSESLESSTARYDLANEEPEFTGSIVSITNTAEDTSEILVYDGTTATTLLGTVPAGATVDFTVMGEYICLQGSGGTCKVEKTRCGVYGVLDFGKNVYAVTGNGAIVGKVEDELAGTWVLNGPVYFPLDFATAKTSVDNLSVDERIDFLTLDCDISINGTLDSKPTLAVYGSALTGRRGIYLGVTDGTAYTTYATFYQKQNDTVTTNMERTILQVTVEITNITNVSDKELALAWLKANATKQ